MTELGFLLDLLLSHKLPKATRDLVASRIKDVESKMATEKMSSEAMQSELARMRTAMLPLPAPYLPTNIASQSPSTIAAMARHANSGVISGASIEAMQEAVDLAKSFSEPRTVAIIPRPEMPPIPPVAVIAQTPAAAAAINSRNQAISDSINGKTDKITGRPRKF